MIITIFIKYLFYLSKFKLIKLFSSIKEIYSPKVSINKLFKEFLVESRPRISIISLANVYVLHQIKF